MDPVTREEMYLNSIAGGGTAPDPPLTREEQYLSRIAAGIRDLTQPFIVNMTPTAQDLSGVMDKTVAEINEAYEAGRKIVFRSWMSETSYMDTDCTAKWHDSATYPSFNGYIFTDTPIDALLFAFTGSTNDGEKSTYGTTIYPLTPMS